ncbi:MAG: hypothetical protein LBU87_05260 [Lactobacillales bacterium]|jgi:hypothetical protein|nr:hypothetical protein [Lactobacillales bacterium]
MKIRAVITLVLDKDQEIKTGDIVDIKDEKQVKSLIERGFATAVVVEKEVKTADDDDDDSKGNNGNVPAGNK